MRQLFKEKGPAGRLKDEGIENSDAALLTACGGGRATAALMMQGRDSQPCTTPPELEYNGGTCTLAP